MDIFLSWSGERSKQVAALFAEWIVCVIQNVKPWYSPEDIKSGTQWFPSITAQLAMAHAGVLFISQDNLNKPWLLFEAGAIGVGLKEKPVHTFLIDLKPEEVEQPLSAFNATLPNKESVKKMVLNINEALGANMLNEQVLRSVYEKWWPDFETRFFEILIATKSDLTNKSERSERDMITEMLLLLRKLEKRTTNPILGNLISSNHLIGKGSLLKDLKVVLKIARIHNDIMGYTSQEVADAVSDLFTDGEMMDIYDDTITWYTKVVLSPDRIQSFVSQINKMGWGMIEYYKPIKTDA